MPRSGAPVDGPSAAADWVEPAQGMEFSPALQFSPPRVHRGLRPCRRPSCRSAPTDWSALPLRSRLDALTVPVLGQQLVILPLAWRAIGYPRRYTHAWFARHCLPGFALPDRRFRSRQRALRPPLPRRPTARSQHLPRRAMADRAVALIAPGRDVAGGERRIGRLIPRLPSAPVVVAAASPEKRAIRVSRAPMRSFRTGTGGDTPIPQLAN